MSMQKLQPALVAVFVLATGQPASAQDSAQEQLARDILADLVAANTAPSGGNDMGPAIAGLVTRLKNAGFTDDQIHVIGKTGQPANLVVRYPARNPSRRPLLLMAHIDVVEARREDWSVDPYLLTEQDGYYYGRGTTDNKAGAAMLIANFIRYRREGFEPDRDLVIMLTGDEETTGAGARLLVNEHRDLVDAELALNTDGGFVMLDEGEARSFLMQTSEKMYLSFVLEATDPGGHSSLPRKDSAISRLARVLVDLQEFRFPISLNETTRAFFRLSAPMASPDAQPLLQAFLDDPGDPELSRKLVEWPYYNAIARTTCVATLLEAGHAENALPQSARATVNCRVVPQSSAEETRNVLAAIGARQGVTVTQVAEALPSPPSPLTPALVDPVTEVAQETWPGITVIPEMSTGATDGLFVRNAGIPVYGVSAIAEDPNDMRAHGQDERIRIRSYFDALEYWYRLVKVLAR